MICLFNFSTFEVCDHNVVMVHLCSSAITDLSLATLLKTAVVVPFFLTRNAFIKTRNRCVFLHPHQTRLFRRALQLCLSARRESNERGKDTPAQGSRARPNFSRVRLKKNFGRTGASSHSKKNTKSLRDSESLSAVRQQTR